MTQLRTARMLVMYAGISPWRGTAPSDTTLLSASLQYLDSKNSGWNHGRMIGISLYSRVIETIPSSAPAPDPNTAWGFAGAPRTSVSTSALVRVIFVQVVVLLNTS